MHISYRLNVELYVHVLDNLWHENFKFYGLHSQCAITVKFNSIKYTHTINLSYYS